MAFVADGAILPRESGVSDLPLKEAVPFTSPEVTLDLPHAGTVRGMGIKEGVTLIAGGGYHGKSTLLKAIQNGVYNHIRGRWQRVRYHGCVSGKAAGGRGKMYPR